MTDEGSKWAYGAIEAIIKTRAYRTIPALWRTVLYISCYVDLDIEYDTEAELSEARPEEPLRIVRPHNDNDVYQTLCIPPTDLHVGNVLFLPKIEPSHRPNGRDAIHFYVIDRDNQFL
jgi:hypothetical protein